MAAKSSRPETDQPSRPVLLMPRAQAEERLRRQIERGNQLLHLPLKSPLDVMAAKRAQIEWDTYNMELLRRLVSTDELIASYPKWWLTESRDQDDIARSDRFGMEVSQAIHLLELIVIRLELFPEAPDVGVEAQDKTMMQPGFGKRVFVVHGHDEAANESVARQIEKLGLEAIVLREQPNQGRTIIEKFEDYSDVGFAVVLLTPDDVGASKSDPGKLQDRARQNVILELGYFMGRLGRNRVSALHKGDIELPSDFDGVLWIAIDPAGAWRTKLAIEMRAAGLKADLNNL